MSDVVIKKPDLNSSDVNRNVAMVDTWIHDTADKLNCRIRSQDKMSEDIDTRIKALQDALEEAIEKAASGSGGDSGGGSGGEGTGDYNDLVNKPRIEGIELSGNKFYSELNLERITNSEIEAGLT